MSYYIYVYENRLNGKVYIGQTNNLLERHAAHVRGNDSKKMPIDAAIKKYGIDNFSYWTISIVETIDEADQEEIFWIAEMRLHLGKSMVYNIRGGGSRGLMTEETRKKISLARKGIQFSGETLRKMSIAKTGKPNPRKGSKLSETAKAELRKLSKKGKTWKVVDGKRVWLPTP